MAKKRNRQPSLNQIRRMPWPDRPWLDQAACAGYPEQSWGDTTSYTDDAQALRERCFLRCMVCPVFGDCQDAALNDPTMPIIGIVAGMTSTTAKEVRARETVTGVLLPPKDFVRFAASRGVTRWGVPSEKGSPGPAPRLPLPKKEEALA